MIQKQSTLIFNILIFLSCTVSVYCYPNEHLSRDTASSKMPIKKRMLLWDYTNTNEVPWAMDKINFNGPISSVSNWNT